MDTLAQLFENIFGVYTPYITELSDGTVYYSADWGYIAKVLIFAIAFYSVFRLIGLFLGGGRK